MWEEIADDFTDALVLGNGASVAVHRGFDYGSLKKAAEKEDFLTIEVQEVFNQLGTDDFELVLELLWRAGRVNEALGVKEDRTGRAYKFVRDALISTVRKVHCSYWDAEPYFASINQFMGRFEYVFSLNYDLIPYWALLAANETHGGNRFKDCFGYGGIFAEDLEACRKADPGFDKATIMFYPHGNLVLATLDRGFIARDERKLSRDKNYQLLEEVLEAWESNPPAIPLFISEGVSERKRYRIDKSPYLGTAFSEVAGKSGGTLVIYGWAMKSNDKHLIDKMFGVPKSRVAVSVYKDGYQNEEEFEDDLRRMKRTIRGASRLSTDNPPEVVFFDAESEGCWIHGTTSIR